MKAEFNAFGVYVDATEKRIQSSAHYSGREVVSRASHFPAHSATDENGAREAYISMSIEGQKSDYEQTPQEKEQGWAMAGSEQHSYLSVEQARALRDALTVAIDCADVK